MHKRETRTPWREAVANRPTTLHDYLAILRRRIWIVVALPVIAAVSAYALAQTQSASYQATAKILVNRANVVSSITNIQDPAIGDPTRFLATEASIARAPELAARVVSAAGVAGVSAGEFLGASSVSPESNADLLDVSVAWPNAADAVRLTNAYAQQFTQYKTALDTQKINDALRTLKVRIASLRTAGATASASYSTLLQYQSELETVGTLLANNTTVLNPATGAAQIRPRPTHTALLGALLGAVLGLGLAFIAEALDRRVRSEQEIEDVLGVPLLGRVPPPPRHLRGANRLVMLNEPWAVDAESFRKLKTTIEFLDLGRDLRKIMVTSAVPREGKSTTVANLAVAFARSGRRVALVDLDLRQPIIHSFFFKAPGRGITDVVAGVENLAGAIQHHFLPATAILRSARSRNGSSPRRSSAANARKGETSILSVLSSGTMTAAAGDALADVLESERLTSALDELAETFELVLADTPPLLAVGDAIALTSKVDAVILVIHAGIQRPLLHELARQLQGSQAPVLGFILTGVAAGDAYGYGYGYGSYQRDVRTETERGTERV